jgi:hypothetical protein
MKCNKPSEEELKKLIDDFSSTVEIKCNKLSKRIITILNKSYTKKYGSIISMVTVLQLMRCMLETFREIMPHNLKTSFLVLLEDVDKQITLSACKAFIYKECSKKIEIGGCDEN